MHATEQYRRRAAEPAGNRRRHTTQRALGLVLNAMVLFSTRYMDAALTKLRADGF
ncbi:hypothetical protein ACQP1V_22795 [Microtetraspora malaysiensis]|uniref:hypothetical protein n=1 Tax=Microtetraspora malaysiensis TaxID=161358 RepID=UPI003D8E6F92